MIDVLQGEMIYVWYYFSVQFEQIFKYWVFGILVGSAISVFAKDHIHHLFSRLKGNEVTSICIASILGIASPLCMYGTIPIAASFYKGGMKDELLGSFMMSSILLNPQLIIYTAVLGDEVFFIRIVSSLTCGIVAGLCIKQFNKNNSFFNFTGFDEPKNRDIDTNIIMRYLKNVGRNVKATGLYFMIGILLSALFQRYVPASILTLVFGNETFGVLMAATIGVPLYACGGGTIPLLQQWLIEGMSVGSAASFMLTGPATKITNLGALKIVLGMKHFIIYIIYIMVFSLITGLLVNLMF